MRRRLRWLFPLALLALIGATCEAPIKKAPPKDVQPGPPEEVDPCTTDPVVINGDECDWLFQRDPANQTLGGFTTEQASIGTGSLKAGPIGDGGIGAAEKFIAEYLAGIPVADLVSITYDFLIAGVGKTAADADQFYLNVYTNLPGTEPDEFYDCRFDYVEATGSTTGFATATIGATDPATVVADDAMGACPTTLADMPAGSHLRAFALNVGDTTASDDGLIGYLDNVLVRTTAGTTTFDFEV